MKKIIFYLLLSLCLFNACRKGSIDKPGVIIKTYSFDNDQNSSLMFQDGEPDSVMTSDARRYNIAHIIRVKPVDEKNIEVANFAPFDIENATVLATISSNTAGSAPQVIKLFTITKIRAHATQIIQYPFVDGIALFSDSNNNVADLSQYKATGIAPAKISFDFTGDNPTILKLKKLAQLKWNIQYHNFNPNKDPNSNWSINFTPGEVRRFTGLMINLGIVFVSDDFKQGFLNEQIIGNDGTTVLTDAEKQKTYNDLINLSRLNCGVVGGHSAVGLGGGSTYGLANYVLKGYITGSISDVPAHELGHCLGYNHASNMTYPKTINGVSTGFCPVFIRTYDKFGQNGLLATTITLNNYYKPADFN